MNAQERFEQYIDEIEDMSEKSECFKSSSIACEIATSHGIGIRDLNAAFTFLTESSLINYIKERQMMAAYKAIISADKFDVEIGISITGYSDQSAFGKKFKERFGLTPKEAFEKKDFSKYIEKLTWNALAKDFDLFEHTTVEVKPVKMKFGISEEQYRLVNRAADLQVLYDLDDYQSEKAFELAQMLDLDIKETFEFFGEYCSCFILDNELSFSESSFLMDVVNIYFNVVPNVYTAWKLIDIIKNFDYRVSEFSPAFLKMYLQHSNLPLRKIVDWAKKNGSNICTSEYIEDGIQEYIDEIVEENYTLDEVDDVFGWIDDPVKKELLCSDISEMNQELEDYYTISDEDRYEWDDRSDEFSKRLSAASDIDTYDEDDTSDGQYFDF